MAVYELGCAAGALTVIFSGDKFGRRLTVMVGELIIIFGAILQASSFSLAQLIVGRIVGMFQSASKCLTSRNTDPFCLQPGLEMVWQLLFCQLGMASALVLRTEVEPSCGNLTSTWYVRVHLWHLPRNHQLISAVRDCPSILGRLWPGSLLSYQ